MPFYVALPHTTIDWTIRDGLDEIEIEERDPAEVTHMTGRLDNGEVARVAIAPPGSAALNPAFDVTPAELVTGADHRPRRLRGDQRGAGDAVPRAARGRWRGVNRRAAQGRRDR